MKYVFFGISSKTNQGNTYTTLNLTFVK